MTLKRDSMSERVIFPIIILCVDKMEKVLKISNNRLHQIFETFYSFLLDSKIRIILLCRLRLVIVQYDELLKWIY